MIIEEEKDWIYNYNHLGASEQNKEEARFLEVRDCCRSTRILQVPIRVYIQVHDIIYTISRIFNICARTESHIFPQEGMEVAPPRSRIHDLALGMAPSSSPPSISSPSNLRATYESAVQNIMLCPSICNPQPPSLFCHVYCLLYIMIMHACMHHRPRHPLFDN